MIKRTPIIDKDDQQLYLDDGMRRYAYWIVVTNSSRSNAQVLRLAQGRGNQENLIKDCKYGLGLAHVPTGSPAANQAYFMMAALAWNLKTWMLNLLQLGDGAVMRCQRFRYQWIWQAGVVAKTGRNTILLKLPAGEYLQRFGVALRLSRDVIENRIRRGYPSLPGDSVCPEADKRTGHLRLPMAISAGVWSAHRDQCTCSSPFGSSVAKSSHFDQLCDPLRHPIAYSGTVPYLQAHG